MIRRDGATVSTQHCHKPNPVRKSMVLQVGRFTRRGSCKLRSEKQRRETRRCARHCLRRKPECPITYAAWRSAELHLKLNLNDFNAPLAKPFCEFLRSSVVGNQAPDSIVRSDS